MTDAQLPENIWWVPEEDLTDLRKCNAKMATLLTASVERNAKLVAALQEAAKYITDEQAAHSTIREQIREALALNPIPR